MSSRLPLVLALVFLAALIAALVLARDDVERLLDLHEKRAVEEFEPAQAALEAARAEVESGAAPVDLDKTVRVLHEMDYALERAGSIEEYVQLVAGQDYRNVDPRILAARKELLDVLLRLYAKRAEHAEQEAAWGFARRWLAPLSLTDSVKVDGALVTGLFSRTPSVGVDTKTAIEDFRANVAHLDALRRDLEALQRELVDVTVRHSDATWDVLQEWDRLCLMRDRAYLAVHSGDWEAALASADEAIALAPLEKEAHLLKALAWIEGGSAPAGDRDPVRELLEDFKQRHPESSAPALLLQGVHAARQGDVASARLLLQQSAAAYPRQAEALTELLDPYRVRARHLRKSREGNSIRELYRATMLGASWFSPDLQLARLDFEAGDFDAGRRKVMDHFARRRSQGQWDLVLYDLTFCEDLLGDDYRRIFPEDVYLDLVVDETLFGGAYELAVKNESEHTLHNATLVLCLQFTDMHPDDYEAFAAETAPEVAAHATTDFGELEVELDLFGTRKGKDDVYAARAILVANEAVVWVDTEDFKRLRAERARIERRDRGAPDAFDPSGIASELARAGLAALDGAILLEVVPKRLLDDDVVIRLPKKLAVVRPVFRLAHAGETFAPSANEIQEGEIVLRFSGVGEFDPGAGALELFVDTPFATPVLRWRQEGADLFVFEGVSFDG